MWFLFFSLWHMLFDIVNYWPNITNACYKNDNWIGLGCYVVKWRHRSFHSGNAWWIFFKHCSKFIRGGPPWWYTLSTMLCVYWDINVILFVAYPGCVDPCEIYVIVLLLRFEEDGIIWEIDHVIWFSLLI